MAEKEPMIVIKKITVVAGGAHGGAWKVAFADFMTAMMAFFLVMWLLATQSTPTKQAVADYFSTPSVIEYNFANFGAQLTLEKLFLDLINEPLKTLETFLNPMDKTPNIMGMGMKKIVAAFLADQLRDMVQNVEVSSDQIEFEIPDIYLFERGTAKPNAKFVEVMERVRGVVSGLEDSTVEVVSMVYYQSLPTIDKDLARNVASERSDIVKQKLNGFFESPSVSMTGRVWLRNDNRGAGEDKSAGGTITVRIKQKPELSNGKKPRPLEDTAFGKKDDSSGDVYENFVKQVSERKKKKL